MSGLHGIARQQLGKVNTLVDLSYVHVGMLQSQLELQQLLLHVCAYVCVCLCVCHCACVCDVCSLIT